MVVPGLDKTPSAGVDDDVAVVSSKAGEARIEGR
jgi:hypothetical protein